MNSPEPRADLWQPRVVERREEHADAITLSIAVDPDCPWFAGHFPERAVLPGVVQLRWAIECAKATWPELGDVLGISNIKFQTPVMPPKTLELVLQRDQGNLKFAWQDPEKSFSSGRVRFS